MRASKEARSHRRGRAQVAKLIIEFMFPSMERELKAQALAAVCAGGGELRFDVASVRSYAERLIAEGERLERERMVFADWTRERGLGPESFEGHMTGPKFQVGDGAYHQAFHDGGWPGPLAREWGTLTHDVPCPLRCVAPPSGHSWTRRTDGTWLHRDDDCECGGAIGPVWRSPFVARHECKACSGEGKVTHVYHPAAANGGAWMIRAGRRLLDTLDGRCPWAPGAAAQPSECQRCWGTGHGYPVVRGPFEDGGRVVFDVQQAECPDCRGTGHSLSGTLPPVEWSAQTRRKAADGLDDEDDESTVVTAWTSAVGDVVELKREWPRTRVAPRGQHRHLGAGYYVRPRDVLELDDDERPSLDDRINGRCWTPAGRPMVGLYEPLAPRWVNGERRHSEQRRERERGIMRQAFETAAANMRDAATFNYAAIAERMARATEQG